MFVSATEMSKERESKHYKEVNSSPSRHCLRHSPLFTFQSRRARRDAVDGLVFLCTSSEKVTRCENTKDYKGMYGHIERTGQLSQIEQMAIEARAT